jgi:hypothetical protein
MKSQVIRSLPSFAVYGKDQLYRLEEVHYAAPLDEYEMPIGEGETRLRAMTFLVLKRTPKGAWINDYHGRRRFVLLTARKQYASETPIRATESFVARKRRQVSILEARRRKADHARKLGEIFLENLREQEASTVKAA